MNKEIKRAIAAPFTKGVNMTNWLEYKPTDQIDADYYTRKDFEDVRGMGCDVVRLPIHFENFCSAENGYEIPDKIWGILEKAVTWASELEMYIILDFHNSTTFDSQTSDNVGDVLTPIWSQLAKHFRGASKYVIYEIMNEPHGIEISVWNEIIGKLFAHIRSIDSEHYIVAGGADWNSFAAMKTLPDFNDDKVIYTFHFYDPHTFTHQGASWCHMERVVGIPFPYDESKMPALPENPTEHEKWCFDSYPAQGTIEAVKKYFDQYVEFSLEKNAPIYCGEFGCFKFYADRQERVNWYKIVTELLSERGISRTSWDYYGSFGLFVTKYYSDGKPMWGKLNFPEDLDADIVEALGLKMPQQ